VLSVRGGEVSGGETFAFGNGHDETTVHVASFLNQYYQSGAAVPDEILLAEETPDADALARLLSERSKRAVHIVVPKRGERFDLIAMATKNARIAFDEGRGGERNRELLEDLRELLTLESYPRRIECFDISNIQGTRAVGSCVTFIDGEPVKAAYRKYRIRGVEGADDYAMMREVLERRIARGLKEGDLPDLLVVDGGRGQLHVALDVLKRMGADMVSAVGIAKVRGDGNRRIRGQERIHLPGHEDSILLDGASPALFLLERVRDEAHRFAVSYHRTLRGRAMGESKLDAIPGVGRVLKQRLLAEFGSVERIRKAPIDLIAAVPGVSRRRAQAIKDALG